MAGRSDSRGSFSLTQIFGTKSVNQRPERSANGAGWFPRLAAAKLRGWGWRVEGGGGPAVIATSGVPACVTSSVDMR